jgi:hypothetical protein
LAHASIVAPAAASSTLSKPPRAAHRFFVARATRIS